MLPSTSHQAALRFARWFALVAIALIGAASLLLANAHAASAQTCVNDVTGVSNNCTANDVRIAEVTVLPGSPDVVCTNAADTVTVLLQTRLRAGANTRYDIGLFIATDGGNAFTGSCARAYLTPTLSSNVGISLTSGVGPFYNGETGTGDTCGDVQQNTDTLYNLPPVTLRCRDADGDGYLDVGSIVAWDNTTNNLCTTLEDAVPNTRAKCSSNTVLRIPISVPPSDVRITKTPDAAAVNAGSQIGFTIVVTNTRTGSGFSARADNVRITDTLPAGFAWVEASDPGNACTISLTNPRVLTCNWGNLNGGASRSVRITAPTTIANCGAVPNVVNLTYSSGVPRVSRSGQATATTVVACSNIEVDKITAPSGSAQPFTFRIRNGATTLQTFSLTDTQDVFVSGNLTPTLTYVVEEDTPVGWQLSSAVCDNGNPPTAVQPLSAPAPGEPALGATVRCTFTNTQLVSVQAIKTVIGASGAFSLTLTGQPDRGVSATPGASGEAVWDNLQPGEYTIGEVEPGDTWLAGDFACTIYQTDGGRRNDDATFSLAAGERAVCEITNTRRGSIIVQKQTEPADSDASFVFTASFEPSFSLISGQSFNSGLLNPGVYTVTETAPPAGWDAISATCSDGSLVGAISLQAGETITCTFVNRQRSSITLVKQTLGFGGENFDGRFAFTSTGGLTTTEPFILETTDTTAQIVFANLLSGAYSIVEQEQAEWQPVSATCTGANSDDPAALLLGPGQAATCTFVNQRLIAGIRLVKEVTTVNDAACANAGDLLTAPPNTPVLYCFTIENTGNVTITAPITLADPAINFVEILPLSEIAPGATVEYTRTHNWGSVRGLYPNTATATGATPLGAVSDEDSALVSVLEPVLTVQKLVGEDGQFYATTTGSPYLTNAGNNLQWRWIISNTGNVTVTLTVTDTLDGEDFDLAASGCTIPATLEPGEGFICNSNPFSATVGQHTNVIVVTGCADTQAGQVCGAAGDLASYITRPQLTVTKSVSNTWGGLLGVSGFPLQISDGDVVTPLVSGGVINLDAGSYTVSEVQQPGYTTAGFAGDCSANGAITMVTGETYACTITNQDTPARVTVTKVVVSERLDDSFDIYLNGAVIGVATGIGETFGPFDIVSGTHTISETGNLSEYITEIGGDCDANGAFTATIGVNYSCTITNTRLGGIVVVKQTEPAGSSQSFGFTADYSPGGFTLSHGQSSSSGFLAPGVYAITETIPAGWEQRPSTCSNGDSPSSVTLNAGAIVTCTFSNRQLGQIRIEKRTDPADSAQTFDFTASYDLGGFSLGHGEANTSAYLTTGFYTVTEVTPLPTGWSQTGFVCDDTDSGSSGINLAPGELVTCVITNTIQRGQIIVDKFTDPAQSAQVFSFTTNFAGDFGLADLTPAFVSGPLLPVSERGVNYSVSETLPDGWTQESVICLGNDGREVNPASIDLQPGETVTCEFTNRINRGQIIVEKITAPADSTQPFGFTANFTDSFELRGGEAITTGFNVLPTSEGGMYSVTENTPAGWILTTETCSDGSSPDNITLEPGESVTCTFTNMLGLARIRFDEPTATNAVNEPHNFTVTVETSINNGVTWQPVANQVVTGAASGVGSLVNQTCTTGGDGKCVLTVNSAAAGQTTVAAQTIVNVLGLDIPVTTSGETGVTRDAVKTWVDLRVRIDPQSENNPLHREHTFAISVTHNLGDGAWVPVADSITATVTVSPQPTGFTLVSDSCANLGMVDGECTVVINSSVAQQYTANATVTANVAGQSITRSTANDPANIAAGGSSAAAKTYVEGSIVIHKTVEETYTRTFDWTIEKTATPNTLDIFDGDSASVDYTVAVTRSEGVDSSFAISGTVRFENVAEEPVILEEPVDTLADGTPITLNCGQAQFPYTLQPQVALVCTYVQSMIGALDTANLVTVTTTSGSIFTATAMVDFGEPTTLINDSIQVSDTNTTTIWSASDTTNLLPYNETFTCDNVASNQYVNGAATYTRDNTAQILYGEEIGDSFTETVTVNCYRPLVSKDVNTSFTRTYTWTVEKTVDPARLDLFEGETATVTYTIDGVKSNPIDSGFGVSGVISITNPHPARAATFNVQDVLPGALVAQVNCGGGGSTVTVGASQTATCTYMASPDGVISGTNVVTATMQTDSGARSYTGAAAVNFGAPTNVVDDSVYIIDTNPDYDGPFESDESFSTAYPVEYGCIEVDFGEALLVFQQLDNTVTIFSSGEADLDSDAATLDLTCYRPTVTKTAQGAYDRIYDWTIFKSADPTRLALFEGETTTVTYTIDVTRTLALEEDFWVSGDIEIFNPNPQRSLSISVVDQLDNGQQLPTTCPATVAPNTTVTCSYGGSVNGATASSVVTNTATITTDAGLAYSSDPVAVDFGQVQPSTLFDLVTITDSQTSQTWSVNDSDTIRYTLPQSCADIVFEGDNTIYRDALVNTASVHELSNRSSTATVDLNCYRLAVSKDANTSFTRQYFWDIEKIVDQNGWDIFVGDQVSPVYTVTAFIVGQQDSNWQVDGAITLSNPAPMPATVVSVVDVLPNGQPAAVSCADGVTVPANSTATCTYSAQTGGVISGDNVFTATLQTSAGSNQYTGLAPVVFGGPTTEISKTVTVSDDLLGGSLGEFGDGQAKSYAIEFQSCSEVTFEEGENSRTFIIDNTATIDGATIDDSAQVTVTCWKPPVIKTANTRYNRVYDYDIVKTVEPAEQTIHFTNAATFAYTLQVTKFIQEENGFAVGGAIVISNPAPINATLVSIEDILPDAANMAIVCAPDNATPYTVPSGGVLNCTYSADLPDKAFRINEARATMSNGVVLSATAPVDFSAAVVTPINDTAPISDTFWSEVQTVFTDTVFTYTEEFTCAGLAYNQETGFFSGAFTNVAQVLVEGGAADSATVALNCYQLDLSVEKTATPTERPEPGGIFTFDVAVVNNSPVPVTLTSLTDDIYGDLTQVSGRMTGTTCALPQALPANGGLYGCSFTADFTGQPGATEIDTVTATGVDSAGTPVEASDSAMVAITDTPSSITLTKTANQTVLPWPGGEVIFTVVVQNTSAVDALRIDTLIDSIYGNITQVGGKVLATTCAAPQVLTPGASYQCAFTVNLTLAAEATQNLVETNIVTAIGVDDDGQPLQASDDETVTVVAAQRAVIGNRVFIDIDPDGASSAAQLAGNQQQDFDEDGNAIEDNVPGITVLLFTVDHVFLAAVQTDADGFYQFNNAPPGMYYAVFVNPGVFPGAWVGYNAAIADDVNSDVDPNLPLEPSVEALIDNLLGAGASLDAARTPTFSIAPGQVYLDLDAGLVDLSGANSVDINGIIWLDANRDGIRQPEETVRIPGVIVELYKVNDVQRSDVTRIDQAPTDANGFFEFLGLDADTYFVRMFIPSNYTITAQNVGDDPTIDSDINPTTGESERVTVANETVTIDAGVFQTPTALDPSEEPMIMSHQIFLPAVQR
jgi:uncharacterized repeat protein (TIGR01451 family)